LRAEVEEGPTARIRFRYANGVEVRLTFPDEEPRRGPQEKALAVLVQCLNHQQFYVSLLAANTLEHLDDSVRPAVPQLKSFLDRRQTDADKQRPWERRGLDEIVTGVVDSQSS
jgi:hypothetical protein